MSKDPSFSHEVLIPPQPMPSGAGDFAGKFLGMLDGKPKDEAVVNEAFAGLDDIFDQIAAGLYRLASMLVGEGEESVGLVETTIATADLSSSHDAEQARHSSRMALAKSAIELLRKRDEQSLAAPRELAPAGGCIQDDELDAAGVYGDELAKMMAGPDRQRVRTWLLSLPVASRVIFVLRAVAGLSSTEIAALLAQQGDRSVPGWQPEAVREIFRQALCSVASQLLHETTAH
jgi:DNA-directed RNA polymerase specialized sigma24 family protein